MRPIKQQFSYALIVLSVLLCLPLSALAANVGLMIDSSTGNLVNSTDPILWDTRMQFMVPPVFDENSSAPGAPSSGYWRLFFQSDGLYYIEDDGSVTGPLGGSNADMNTATYDSDTDGLIDTGAGGLELDTSSATGIPRVDGGTWSVDKFLDLSAATELTINNGSVTITQSTHTIAGEGGSDDGLHEINGSTENRILYLWPASTESITLLHGVTNIVTPTQENYTIPANAVVMLIYDGSNWRLSGAAGSGGVDAEDSGSLVVGSSEAFNFASNLSVSDDGDGTVSVSASTGGTDVSVDLTNNGSDDVSVLERINTANDDTDAVTNNTTGEILIDFGKLIDTNDDDQLYGLIRYQSSAPSTADEKVYIDSDTNELKVYDAGTSSWITIAGGGGGGTPTYSFSFTCPTDPEGDDLTLEVEIDDNQDFSSKIIDAVSSSSESGWKIFDGSVWTDMSAISGTGVVPSGYQGNRVEYEFSNSDIGEGTVYYVRFRVSDDGGSTWGDWTGETLEW